MFRSMRGSARTMNKALLGLVAAAMLLQAQSLADTLPDPPKLDYSLGPSLAYAAAPNRGGGLVYGIDASLAIAWNLWAGCGVRSFENFSATDRALLPYAEAGFWLFVNVGAGYTFDLDRNHSNLSGPHVFVGYPQSLTELKIGPKPLLLFVEPYYRPTFAHAGTLHEAGLLLKVSSWTGHS